MRRGKLGLRLASLREAQIVEAEVGGKVGLIVPSEEWSCPGHVRPLGEPRAPPSSFSGVGWNCGKVNVMNRTRQSSVIDSSTIPLYQYVTVLPAQSAWGFSSTPRFRHETHNGEIGRQVRLHVLWWVSSEEWVTSDRSSFSDYEVARTERSAFLFTHVMAEHSHRAWSSADDRPA